ncbi:phosphopantetheine-binding protein [Pectinatus frisingensis]|uniref:phosphopantetheine-binding protein n=1 Tax=Pectinatus frisingensis TaxID=865 RepID=UPI0018C56863|nr:phosphopantetheine-binding protein [Pectinatus frisingensis]
MTKEKFIEKMADILDTEDKIGMDSILVDIEEWDSLSLVSFMALANVECKKKLSLTDVKQAKSINDLYTLLQK